MNSQVSRINIKNFSNSIPVIRQCKKNHQSEVVIHKIKKYESIRVKYSYEVFIKEKVLT